MSDWFSLGGSAIGGIASIFGGRRQQSAANAQAAAQMQFERENMFHQNQVALDFANHQNRFNAGQAQEARDWNANQAGIERTFNAEEAAKNRAFQEQMSNTQYQRATSDLKSAGLNPMLAYSQGGAGNVSGSSASTSAPSTSPASGSAASPSGLARAAQAQQFNYLASAVASAAQVGQMVSQVGQINAQTEKTKVDTAATALMMKELEYKWKHGYQEREISNKADILGSEVSIANEKRYQASESSRQSRTETALKELSVPKAKAEAEFQQMMSDMMKGGANSASVMERLTKMFLPMLFQMIGGK